MRTTKNTKIYACDFETTVYEGQVDTEVWLSGCVELYTEDCRVFHNIHDLYQFFKKQKCNIKAYFHNLKFDGSFWLSYLLLDLGYKQAFYDFGEYKKVAIEDKNMPSKSFKYSISDKGLWYSIIIKEGHYKIEIIDSLKLLPFSLKRIGESFQTKHKKLDMEYKGFRYAGCPVSSNELEYFKHDLLVLKEGLEIMYDEGHNKLTVGSCAFDEYKNILSSETPYDYKELFPNLYEVDFPGVGYDNYGDYIRKSYKGGWCYVVKGKENKVYKNGLTADVNSLYPSMLSSESGNHYPVGMPNYFIGKIPDKAKKNHYYFVRIKTRFYLKEGYLPFIQIKNNLLYKGTECLESSDIYDKRDKKYYTHYYDEDGTLCDTRVELVLTCTDYELLKEHYDLVDFEIIDGCYFRIMIGIFDNYINKYRSIKISSTGAKRELAKLFLNSLYGKFATSPDSSFKYAYIKEDKSIGFKFIEEHKKKPAYIPVGSAITSYARNFTIRAAQQNYHGVENPGFIYADTDSIHCDLSYEEVKGINVHDSNFCCWKLESGWDNAIFVRQKTYIEHVIEENQKPIDRPYYNIKCAGMTEKCKQLFNWSLSGIPEKELKTLNEEQRKFLYKDNRMIKRTIEDFKIGLEIPGKLRPKRIKGGTILEETTYKIR